MNRAPAGATQSLTDRLKENPISVALYEGSFESSLILTPGLRPGLLSAAIFDGSLSDPLLDKRLYAGFLLFPFYFFLFPFLFCPRETISTIRSFCTTVPVMRRLPVRTATIERITRRGQLSLVTRIAQDVISHSSPRPTCRCARSATQTSMEIIRH